MRSWLVLARLGWRNARRAPRRTLLVMALIALPVAAVVAGATAARMTVAADADRVRGDFGQADVTIASFGESGAVVLEDLDAVLPEDGRAVLAHSADVHTVERFDSIFLTDALVTDPLFEGRYRLLRGRAPTAPGQIAPDLWLVDQYDLELGDTLRIDEVEQPFTVVGVMVQPEATHNQQAAVAPGSLDESPQLYVNLGSMTADGLSRALTRRGYEVQSTGPPKGGVGTGDASSEREIALRVRGPQDFASAAKNAASAGVFAGGVVAVGLAGLVASAAFAVSLRRRQRELGLLGTVGADVRLLRRSVLLEGAVVGLLGSAAGVAIGLLALLPARPRIEQAAHRLLGPIDLNFMIIAGGLLLGTAGAAFAAWLPARAAARQSVVEALASRRPATPRRGRLAVIGVALAGSGLLVVAGGAAATSQGLLVGGAFAAFAGVLLATPVLIERLSALAGPLPPAARIGVRDLARNRARSAALFAAVLAALTLPVAAVATVRSERLHSAEQYVPSMGTTNVLLVPEPGDVPGHRRLPVASSRLDAAAVQFTDLLQGIRASGTMRPLQDPAGAVDRPVQGRGGSWSRRQQYVGPEREGQPFTGDVVVADHSLLEALGIGEHSPALDSGTVLGVGAGTVDGGAVELIAYGRPPARVAAVETAAPAGYELPGYLMSEKRARELGYDVGTTGGWLFRLDHQPTAQETDALRAIVARQNLFVSQEAGRFQPPVVPESLVLAVGGAVALGVVSIVAALAAAESRRERILLAAIGASPRAGRAAGAIGAAALVLLAGLAATVLGVGLVGAHQLGRGPTWEGGPGYPAVIPWNAVAFVTAAVPAAALAVSWLLNGRVDPRDVRVMN